MADAEKLVAQVTENLRDKIGSAWPMRCRRTSGSSNPEGS